MTFQLVRSGRMVAAIAIAASATLALAGCGSSVDGAGNSADDGTPSSATVEKAPEDEADSSVDDATDEAGAGNLDNEVESDPPDTELPPAEVSHLEIAVTPVPDFAPIFYAVAAGIFADNGLDVETAPIGTQVIPALLGGSYQAATNPSSSLISAVGEGLDVRVVAPGIHGDPGLGFGIYSIDSNIADPSDLAGKTVAVNQSGGVFELGARAALNEYDVPADSVTYQVLPLGSMVGALVDGTVDAAFLVPPFSTLALSEGAHEVVDAYADTALTGTPLAPVAMSATFVAENPATVQRFQLSLRTAAGELNDMSDEEYQAFLADTFDNLSADVIAEMPRYHFYGEVDGPGFEKVASLMRDLGWFSGDFNVNEFVVAE